MAESPENGGARAPNIKKVARNGTPIGTHGFWVSVRGLIRNFRKPVAPARSETPIGTHGFWVSVPKYPGFLGYQP